MDDSELQHSPQAPPQAQVLQQPRFGVEISELSVHSIHHERQKYWGCLVGFLQDYRFISVQEL